MEMWACYWVLSPTGVFPWLVKIYFPKIPPILIFLESNPGSHLEPSTFYLGFLTFRYEILQTMFVEQKQSPKHRVGMAFGLQSHFYLNLGFSMEDHSDRNWVSAGLSWRGPRLKLAYGLQSEQGQNPGQRHLIDLWFDL